MTGKADLTTVPVDKADFQLKITTPGEVLDTNGDAEAGTASWTFDAGKVGDVNAVIAVADPNAPSPVSWTLFTATLVVARLRRRGAARPPHPQPPGPPAALTRADARHPGIAAGAARPSRRTSSAVAVERFSV